jgi:ribosomal protein S18 acetylase RimI-like enzyme
MMSDALGESMDIRAFLKEDTEAVIALWERCGLVRPWNDPRKDVARKLTVQPDLFLVGVLDRRVVAAVMAGYEGHRGWINYLAVEPNLRRGGLGRAMVAEAERRLGTLGCPKVNLQIRRGNTDVAAFYARLGYVEDAVISMGKRLEVDGA